MSFPSLSSCQFYFTWDPILAMRASTVAGRISDVRPDVVVVHAGVWMLWQREFVMAPITKLTEVFEKRLRELIALRETTKVSKEYQRL